MLKDKVAFIGLGACGSNIALLFQKKHYHTLFINGSEQDTISLSLYQKNVVVRQSYAYVE